MMSMKPVTMLIAAVMLVLATPARAIQTPDQAVGEDTLMLVWIDMTQITDEMIRANGQQFAEMLSGGGLDGLGLALPVGDAEQMAEGLIAFRAGYVEAGGEGLLISLGMPADDTWSPTMSMLAKTSGEIDMQAMSELVGSMSDSQRTAQLEGLGEGWHRVSILSDDGEEQTSPLPTPDEQAGEAFARQLSAIESPGVSLAFRLQPEMLNMVLGLAGLGAEGAQDPQLAMLTQLIQPLQELETIGLAVSSDDQDEMQFDVQMVFNEEAQAAEFFNMYNSIMAFMPMMVFQQVQNDPNAPNPATINQFFMMLRMQNDGDALSLTLGSAFFELAEEMMPLFEGMVPPAGGGIR